MRPSRPQPVSHASASSQRSQNSSRYAFDPLDDPRPEPFKFPSTHHLIVTTAQGVYTYGSHGITEIFKSGSNGIVAAKRANNGPRVLAVADDQLVILHDVRKGMRRSYRLRSEDGRIRMLRFAKGPDRLFFTTTLQNTVQAYDLEHDRLLDPSFQHPSPPTAFALSSTSHLLLSASASPPVIRLTNLLLNSRSLKLRPQCSSAAVVAVEFHPERGNIFILAFADATCAVYDAAYIFQAGNRGQRGSDASVSGTGWEIAHIKNLHAPGKATIGSYEDSHTGLNTGDIPERITDNNRTAGVLAVGFVPGLKTIVVTVGLDGRCCVVDFAATEAHTATVICAWDITGSPTSLSILSPSPKENLELPIARLRDQDSAHRPKIVAIGCQDGEVLLFDLAGELLRQQILGPATLRVIDVEWMEGGDWPEPSLIQPTRNDTSKSRSRRNRRSIGAVLASGRPVEEEVVAISNDSVAGQGTGEALTKALSEAETPLSSVSNKDIPARDNATVRQVSAVNHMDFPSVLQTPYPEATNYEDTSGRADTSSSASLENMLRTFQFPEPPKSQGKPLQRKSLAQLPRNNSWAVDLQTHDVDFRAGSPGNNMTEKAGDLKEVFSKSAFAVNSRRRRPQIRTVDSTDQAAAYQEDLWTDIIPDDPAPDQRRGSSVADKENNSPSDGISHALDSMDDPSDAAAIEENTRYRLGHKGKQRDVPFDIYVDESEQTDHPQPLSAHPEKAPSYGPRPLAPIDANSSHPGSKARPPFHRQRYKNGKPDSHRSSIYGPGALTRKVQQEVMITVNVELDVLRREMDKKFTDQKAWFIKELMNSQEWTLRVEEENRKLREELAKERKRREGNREGIRTLC